MAAQPELVLGGLELWRSLVCLCTHDSRQQLQLPYLGVPFGGWGVERRALMSPSLTHTRLMYSNMGCWGWPVAQPELVLGGL